MTTGGQSDHIDRSHPVVAFRDRLLKLTFDWCVSRSSFYRERFSHISSFSGLVDLPRLPVLSRDEVVQNRDALSCDEGPPACFQFTTGTTGTFLPLYRSASEVAFISKFYGDRMSEQLDLSKPRPLCLSIVSAYHGASTPMPSGAYVLSVGAYDRSQVETARNLLSRTFNFPGVENRVSVVIGFDILVRALTAYLVDEGVSPSTFGVRHIFTTGGYISTAVKKQLGSLWNATVHDRLSMSEIFGGAVETIPGGPWVFDVEAIPEVVHPRTLEPVHKGIGTLLMTSLYPFSQMSPMVRYDTGDMVEVLDDTSAFRNNLVVKFRGRRRRSVIDVSGSSVEPLVLCTDLYDFLESCPDIAITSRFSYITGLASREYVGKPHCELRVTEESGEAPTTITVRLGLRYAPWLFPERVNEIQNELRSKLFENSPPLARRVSEGSLAFRIDVCTADRVATFSTE